MRRYDRSAQALAVVLAATAGYVDAIGFLRLGGFFVSFMSGNTTCLAVGAVRSTGMATIAFALIVSFVAGVVAGSFVADVAGTRRNSAVLVLAACVTAAAALFGRHHNMGLFFLPAAMGITNAVFQRDGEVSIGVTYMTGTLVRLGRHIAAALRGRDMLGWLPYLLLWLGLLCGGVLGTWIYPVVELAGLWFAVIVYLVLAAVAPRAAAAK